jgi:hypothetical protein
MRLPRQKKLYKRGILMEVDFVAARSLQEPENATWYYRCAREAETRHCK